MSRIAHGIRPPDGRGIAQELERRVAAAGISINELCPAAGVARSTLTRWKSGATRPTISKLNKLKLALLERDNADIARNSEALMAKKWKVQTYRFDDLKPGMYASYDTVLGEEEVAAFAELTGDISPLHVDRAYGGSAPFGTNVVHGMLAASHFSTLVGVFLPGRRALLNSIEAAFLTPVPVGSTVTVTGKISALNRSTSSIQLNLAVLMKDTVCVTGKAIVTVRPDA